MHVCVCPSRLGMLIYCMQCVPAVLSDVHTVTLLLLAGPVQVLAFTLSHNINDYHYPI